MTLPSTLLDLGVTLRPEHDAERRRHVARLAGRLGFRHVWAPLTGDPAGADVTALVEWARPARVGLVLTGDPADMAGRIAALPDAGPAADVLLEIHAPATARDRLVAAAGGSGRWRANAYVTWYDPEAAGLVVPADEVGDRARAEAAVEQAAARRRAGGGDRRTFPISVALTVSIGRTMSEAEARALRDPALSGPRHPRRAGLFGTLEHAQEQALGLARAGADAVRATLADERDTADLLAQLRAVAVGPTAVLHARGD